VAEARSGRDWDRRLAMAATATATPKQTRGMKLPVQGRDRIQADAEHGCFDGGQYESTDNDYFNRYYSKNYQHGLPEHLNVA
jgi:hypothetical protein